ncbi:MAG: hypothetical protein HDR15_15545 [Lachnospiraceae bacterium]|nr:hypothetical protein [Lachnospiraceae bacterium]
MKMKFCSVLTAVIFMLSQGMTVSAAAMPNPAADLDAQNGNARSTISLTFQGNSYTTTQEGVQCRCDISGQTDVTAGTDKYPATVTISSKSYNTLDVSSQNGRGDNAAGNTVTVHYSGSSYVKCTYQEHGAPYTTTVKIWLRRY